VSKAEIRALERVYISEVAAAVRKNGSHLFQSKAAIYRKLADEGLLRFVNSVVLIGGGALGSVAISGYELTHAGRLLYCLSCDDDDHDGSNNAESTVHGGRANASAPGLSRNKGAST
jgi:hypothetical protein